VRVDAGGDALRGEEGGEVDVHRALTIRIRAPA
jgi:hypothetical protein